MKRKKLASKVEDEILFCRYKAGDEVAVDALFTRYYELRKPIGRIADPENFYLLDEGQINDAFTDAFIRCCATYKNKTSKFRTFFLKIYQHTIVDQLRMARERWKITARTGLDTVLNEGREDSEPYCLHDLIPDRSVLNQPKAFIEYDEAVQLITDLPENMPPICLELARLVHVEGWSIAGAARKLGIRRDRARYLLDHYDNWARTVLENYLA